MNSRAVKDDLGDVGPAIAWAGAFVDDAGLSAEVRFAVDLSLEEALANLILHGRAHNGDKGIVVNVAADSAGAIVTIRDRCEPFDVTRAQSEESPSGVGGRGLRLLRGFAAEISYASDAGHNALTLRFPAG